MALYIEGNRILTEEEKGNEGCGAGLAALLLLVIGALFVLSPGIIITSLLNLGIHFTTSQLWGCAIVCSIIVAIGLAMLVGTDSLKTSYLATAVICSLFMFLSYLFAPDNNCFYNTVRRLLLMDSPSTKEPTGGVANDSVMSDSEGSLAFFNDNNYNERAEDMAVADTAAYEEDNSDIAMEYEEDEVAKEVAMLRAASREYEEEQPLQNEEADKVFDVVEQMPSFPGGEAALMKFLSSNVHYPVVAEENGIQGRVVLTFVIERDGSISDVKVVKSVDPSLDKEAVRVIQSMPQWRAGTQDGKPVRVKYTMTVTFGLE